MWKSIKNDLIGSEGGIILQDEEYEGSCRITLERCRPYDAITCGVYGDMVHTVYSDPLVSQHLYEMMKKDLQAFIDADIEDLSRRSDFYEAFIEKVSLIYYFTAAFRKTKGQESRGFSRTEPFGRPGKGEPAARPYGAAIERLVQQS